MITAITGHRVVDVDLLKKLLPEIYKEIKVSYLIQGMAAGADLTCAGISYLEKIPFAAYRPWAGHSAGKENDKMYQWALTHADKVRVIHDTKGFPGNWVYHKRNHCMVDDAQQVLAVWDGRQVGGTYAAVRYALDKNVTVWNFNPATKKLVKL